MQLTPPEENNSGSTFPFALGQRFQSFRDRSFLAF